MKRMVLFLFSLMLALAVVAACQNENQKNQGNEQDASKENAPAPSGDEKTPPAPPSPPKPVELVFWQPSSGWSEEKFMEDYGNAIQAKYPHITTKFMELYDTSRNSEVLLQEMIADRKRIDITFNSLGSMYYAFLDFELQQDITDLVKQNNFDLSRFDSAIIGQAQKLAGGKLYGLPVENTTHFMLYNKEILDKFGVSYPTDGMTWDEMYELAKSATRKDGDTQYYGFGATHFHYIMMNQLSITLVDPNGNKPTYATDGRWKTHLDNLKRFFDIPGNHPGTAGAGASYAQFWTDRTLALYAGLYWIDNTRDESMIDFVQLPTYADLPGVGPQPYPTFFNITNMAIDRQAAFDAISYLTSDEFQMARSKAGVLTVLNNPEIKRAYGQDIAQLKGKNLNAFFPQITAESGEWTPYTGLASTPMMDYANRVLMGEMDFNTAMRENQEVAEQQIAEYIESRN